MAEVRLVLICGVGTGNVGNDVSLRTAMQALRGLRPDARFLVATPHVDGARAILDTNVVPLHQNLGHLRSLRSPLRIARAVARGEMTRLRSLDRIVASSDAVIVTGTGIFDDFGEKPWNMPYALLSWVMAARRHGRAFSFLAVGAGPIHGRGSRLLMTLAARAATTVSYRDKESRDFMKSTGGGRADARVVPDLAFGHPAQSHEPARPTSPTARIGLGVMDYGGWSRGSEGPAYERYVRMLVELTQALRDRGHEVDYLVGQPVDVSVVRDIMSRLSENDAPLPQIVDFDDLLVAAGRVDIVIATRYHNVVAAVMMGRPVISLSYAPKNRALLQAVGLEGFDRPIEDANSTWVLARLDDLQSGKRGLRSDIEFCLRQWRDDVFAEAERILLASRVRTGTFQSSESVTGPGDRDIGVQGCAAP